MKLLAKTERLPRTKKINVKVGTVVKSRPALADVVGVEMFLTFNGKPVNFNNAQAA